MKSKRTTKIKSQSITRIMFPKKMSAKKVLQATLKITSNRIISNYQFIQ